MTSALRPTGSTRRWRELRLRVLVRDQGLCWICGGGGATSVDHLLPRAEGGTDDPANLRAAHRRCNSGRRGEVPTRPEPSRRW